MYERGDTVAGKYRIECQLGQGGMGSVFGATHLALGTKVALKFLRPDIAQNPAVAARFLHEARASAQLRGESVCRVFDVGKLDSGVPYIVMEWLAGSDLGSFLRATGPMPPEVICEYVLQACHGLAEAHALGIVHRDLKPANLFLTQRPDGTILLKVLDFGVAKAPDAADFNLTQTTSVMGSPGYMSPEQLRSSHAADARSDIWSLGIVMYELLSGSKPFLASSITELALRVAMDPLPALPPIVPAPLAAIVARCLAKDPRDRFADIAALASAVGPLLGAYGYDLAASVERVLRGASVPAIAVPRASSSPTAVPTTLRGASGMVSDPPRSSRRLPLVVALGVAAGALAIVFVTALGGGAGARAPAAAAQPTHIELPVAAAPAAVQVPPAQPTIKPQPPATHTVAVKPAAPPPKPEAAPAHPKKPAASPAKANPSDDIGDSRF